MNRRKFLCFTPAVPLMALVPSLMTEPVAMTAPVVSVVTPADIPSTDIWMALKRDFPEWASALDDRLAAMIDAHNNILYTLAENGTITVAACRPQQK